MRKLILVCVLMMSCLMLIKPAVAATEEEIKELFQQACLWAVGDTAKVVRKATEDLIAIGTPAYKYILENEMDTNDTLRTRAIFEILGKKPNETLPLLLEGFNKETKLNAKANYISLFGQIKAKEAIPSLIELLRKGMNSEGDDRKLVRSIIYALIDLDAKESANDITKLINDEKYFTVIAAANALGAFQAGNTWLALIMLLSDEHFEKWLPAQDNLVRWLNSNSPSKKEIIEVLSNIARGKISIELPKNVNINDLRRRALITLGRASLNDQSKDIQRELQRLIKDLRNIKIPELQSGLKEIKWLLRKITH